MLSRRLPWFTPSNLAITAGLLALTYFVILGEIGQRDPHLLIRILNGAAAGTLILTYVLTALRRADRIDRGVLLGLLLFAAAAVLAQFPRQAFDALLAALLYTAALFVARGLLSGNEARVAFVRCLMFLSAFLTFATAARWLLPAFEWWSLTDWSVIPPLDLNLQAAPWGHRHDLALLIVMLYPSWWVGRTTPLRAAMATVVGIHVVRAARAALRAHHVPAVRVLRPAGRAALAGDRAGRRVGGAPAVVLGALRDRGGGLLMRARITLTQRTMVPVALLGSRADGCASGLEGPARTGQ